MKQNAETVRLEKIVGGGQAMGTLENGKKAFVWGGLPGELVEFRVTKKKAKLVEGVVTNVLEPSASRIAPVEPDSYLSTSPWQIMDFETEQSLKTNLIGEAFEMHDVQLPQKTKVFSDNKQFGYRNKVEFSWWGDTDGQGSETLDLAFFRRGSKGKLPVESTALAREEINVLARAIRDVLRTQNISARQLKTLLIRCSQNGDCTWQLYVKDKITPISTKQAEMLPAQGGEIIYSDPRSPASRITERLASFGNTVLTDTILGVPFRYATEGFFQVNLPVYEKALRDMKKWVQRDVYLNDYPTSQGESEESSRRNEDCLSAASSAVAQEDEERTTLREEASHDKTTSSTVDMYSGVGTIGLTTGGEQCTLVEVDENAVREMKRNIAELNSSAQAILAKSEDALEYITSDKIIIVDPPRAGLHANVIDRLLEAMPPRIIYLSCNPVTQARDVSLLLDRYRIVQHTGYNFFPRTPHIEHLVVLDQQ